MDNQEYRLNVNKIGANIRKIRENDIDDTFENDIDTEDELDATTRKALNFNKLTRDTAELIQNMKSAELISNQQQRLEALESDFNDALSNVQAADISHQEQPNNRNKHSPSDELNPFLPQYSALQEKSLREELKETEPSHRKQGPPTTIHELRRLMALVATNTQKIKTTVHDISRMDQFIGTSNDSAELRERLTERFQYSQNLAKDTMTVLSEINTTLPEQKPSEQRRHNKQVQRRAKELEAVMQQLQKVQRESVTKQREASHVAAGATDEKRVTGETGGLQQQTLLSQECDAIEERNEAIQKLERDILDVNEVFQQLHQFVEEQGEKIDRIEDHVATGEEYVEKAKVSVEAAKRSQMSRRKKLLICGIVGIIFLITLIVILVVSFS